MAKLTFHGGAKEVTGANYLIETEKSKVVVDVGMAQGSKHARESNYKPFGYDPATVDAVCITHAHIDHTGRLPKFIKDGFHKEIYATKPTVELAEVMLEDSQGILENEAEREGREPLYSEKDVKDTVQYFNPVQYGEKVKLTQDITARFRDAGHILGSAIIEMWVTDSKSQVANGESKTTKLVFSGDLGNPPVPLLAPTEFINDADVVLMETVYGDRIHEDREERKELLENAVEDTVTSGGTLMVPSFALERTQEMLFELNSLVENSRIPKVPVFIDSPLAIKATRVYQHSEEYFNKRAMYLIESGDELFKFPNLEFTMETEESKAINNVEPPKVIIAGSGMSTGGRILHHEKRYLSDPKSMLLIIGYQAHGTLGRQILDGAESVTIFGEEIPVRCKVRAIGGYSAHADQDGLYKWIKHTRDHSEDLKKVFCIQGEEDAATTFATLLRDRMAVDAEVPDQGDVFEF